MNVDMWICEYGWMAGWLAEYDGDVGESRTIYFFGIHYIRALCVLLNSTVISFS